MLAGCRFGSRFGVFCSVRALTFCTHGCTLVPVPGVQGAVQVRDHRFNLFLVLCD